MPIFAVNAELTINISARSVSDTSPCDLVPYSGVPLYGVKMRDIGEVSCTSCGKNRFKYIIHKVLR